MGKMQTKGQPRKRISWLQWSARIAGWLPLGILAAAVLTGNMSFNPVEGVLRWTGRSAVIFLLLSLVCTPLHKIFILPEVFRLRKPLGLFAALYAALHFAVFAIWDYGLNFQLIWGEIVSKPFIIFGLVGLIILIVLAATSFRFWQRKLGSAWVWLHRLVYAAGIMVAIHYLLAVKGDLLSLQGAYTAPLFVLGVLMMLFMLRIPAVHQALQRLFKRD